MRLLQMPGDDSGGRVLIEVSRKDLSSLRKHGGIQQRMPNGVKVAIVIEKREE